ncbi:MAG: hypothetical protein GWP60_11295 [Gammaproteobacteria bacterium]|jgi:hypothetical protein|nr:hypothetical protein [Gammaproteobacteria bacterium]HSG97295.1 hypothetical protein [Woeseiaceae bacterium]
MDAERANQWLTLVANIGVVAGIVFLAIEIQQNTESQDEFIRVARANAYQARAFAASSLWSNYASSPEVIDTMVTFDKGGGWDSPTEALDTMSDQDRWRLNYIALSQVAILDNNFYQYNEGYLDADRYQRIDAQMLKRMIPVFDAFGIVYPTAMAEEVERLRQQRSVEE